VINYLVASVVAGAVASVVLVCLNPFVIFFNSNPIVLQCPMEETRIKMVGDKTWEKENLVSGIARLLREDGVLSTFKGLPAMLSKQVASSIHFSIIL
jgi:hypothetical protein